ncbi:Clavesin-1 like protein [Argiope bruennichi]|uniref:Clavesin-1 like protein n=1 Tax=Argiope bruennichi TaxID=94029 RepID=A0A8T0EUN6_ARGBR|nr:Clavesin-1 like protein [Argiope bruennichi]
MNMSVSNGRNRTIEYTSLKATTLEESVLKDILEEIGETENEKVECLKTLREKLKGLQDIECCMDEGFLLKFLRVSKFDCEKAFDRIKKYYLMQEKMVSLLKNASVPISTIRNMKYTFALPYRAEDNSAVTIARMGVIDYSKISFESRSFLDVLSTEHLLNNPITQMCGITTVFDFTDFKFSSVLAVNPKTAYDYMHTVQVYVHPNNDNWKSLHSCIPPEILPEDLGGYLPQTQLIDLLEHVETFEKDYLEQSRKQWNYGTIDEMPEDIVIIQSNGTSCKSNESGERVSRAARHRKSETQIRPMAIGNKRRLLESGSECEGNSDQNYSKKFQKRRRRVELLTSSSDTDDATDQRRLDRVLKAEAVGKDLRGQADGSSRKTNKNLVNDVKQHIQRFPQFESHYTRNHNPGRKHLNPEQNSFTFTVADLMNCQSLAIYDLENKIL